MVLPLAFTNCLCFNLARGVIISMVAEPSMLPVVNCNIGYFRIQPPTPKTVSISVIPSVILKILLSVKESNGYIG